MNRDRWPSGAAAAAGVLLGALFVMGPARADTTVDSPSESTIKAKGLPVTAAGFEGATGPGCDPSATEDVWYFALHPGTPSAAADGPLATGILVTFAVPEKLEPSVRTLTPDVAGTASTRTPAGWTLLAATARIHQAPSLSPEPTPASQTSTDGAASVDPAAPVPVTAPVRDELVLVGTCSGRTPERVLVPAAPPVPGRTKATVRARATPSLSGTAPAVAAPVPAATDRRAAPATRLPTTGSDITGMFALGLALVVTGFLLLIVRRNREKPTRRPAPSDWY